MKTNTTKIRMMIQYLRSLTDEQLHWAKKSEVEDKIQAMGAKRIGSGCYSTVYEFEGFAIKLADEDFNKLRTLRQNEFVKKYVVPFYWIHRCGRAMVCKLVEFVQMAKELHNKIRRKMQQMCRNSGINPFDFHTGNLVKVPKLRPRYMIVDYGCVLQ